MAESKNLKYSLVEFFDQTHESSPPGHCGYCGKSGSIADGLWGYRLTVTDYKNLLQRGWRRSGKYVYKPLMTRTCCPQYAIRCDAVNFKLTKSQKKVIKRMYNFLAYGVGDDKVFHFSDPTLPGNNKSDSDSDCELEDFDGTSGDPFTSIKEPELQPDVYPEKVTNHQDISFEAIGQTLALNQALDRRENLPELGERRQRKAKEIRLERKMLKMAAKGLDPSLAFEKKPNIQPTSLESYLSKPMPENSKHVLETRLVTYSDGNTRDASYRDVFELYKKYELSVHKKTSEAPTEKQFIRFLVDSPLLPEYGRSQSFEEMPVFGSFHLEYYLDGKLIGVDVLDILPDCVTSVYFFYDPDYRFLSLGTYSILREIVMVRELNKRYKDVCYASLGFYVHSCQKMHYKAKFQPSFLLCPETFNWYPLEACLTKLESQSYQRFGGADEKDIFALNGNIDDIADKMLVLYKRNLMTFDVYKTTLQRIRRPSEAALRKEIERILRYGNLVGLRCVGMALYCDSAPISITN